VNAHRHEAEGNGALATPRQGAEAERPAPAWGNTSWLNTEKPLTLSSLKGEVVLLNFWTFTCYNCTNTLPALIDFDERYRDQGLVIIGMHDPEFPPSGGEHDKSNVQRALNSHGITYANAQDNDHATWNLYGIRYWPSFVLIDRNAAVGGVDERSRAQGVVIGTGADRLQMDYVPATADVKVGDRVVTSGIDGIYPKGFVIGQIESIERGSGEYRAIVVRPAVDFSALEAVLVVLPSAAPATPPPAPADQGHE